MLSERRDLARLKARYCFDQGRTAVRHEHSGSLRLLKSLYPEGRAICHSVLVHPPSGLVGGDVLDMELELGPGAHALVTTPGATRFYRGEHPARQHLSARLGDGARLEWLPLEAIAYPGCDGQNEMRFALDAGAELLAWDMTALGLPGAGQPFASGRFTQHLEICGRWLERGTMAADDALLMNGAAGLAGHRCLASLVFAAGLPIERARRERALDAARAVIDAQPLHAGATAVRDDVLVLRALAPLVEPASSLLRRCWAAWRQELWGLPGDQPRLWSM